MSSTAGSIRFWQLSSAELRSNVVAGVTTAVMLVPQAMAYAMLAGLPPIVGLYAAGVPLFAYALLGSSRELAVGPVAMDSLLTAATVGAIAQSGSRNYLELAALLALMVGVFQIALGALRAGFLTNFLSRPVISGFTSAAAIIIATSQAKLLLGVELPRSTFVVETLGDLAQALPDTHGLTLAFGAGALFALIALKRLAPRWPRALIVVGASGAFAWLLDAPSRGVDVVGSVPAGLPRISMGAIGRAIDVPSLAQLWPGALTIAFVSFMEAISVASKMADRGGQRVAPNREFAALGLANLSSGLVGGYPVAGGLSRTAVNADAGATHKVAGLITGTLVLVTLAWFTGLLAPVPTAALGAMIVAAIAGLVDLAEARRLWVVKRNDFWLLVATFIATLTLGIQRGILVGVGLSVLLLVVRTTRPHTAVLGRLPGTEVYRNLERFPDAIPTPGVLVVRLDAQLYFGNVTFLRTSLEALERECVERFDTPLRAVVLDASGINQLDASAEAALHELHERYRDREVELVLASVKGPVRDVLGRSGLQAKLGEGGMALRVHDAMVRLRCTETPPDTQPDAPLDDPDARAALSA